MADLFNCILVCSSLTVSRRLVGFRCLSPTTSAKTQDSPGGVLWGSGYSRLIFVGPGVRARFCLMFIDLQRSHIAAYRQPLKTCMLDFGPPPAPRGRHPEARQTPGLEIRTCSHSMPRTISVEQLAVAFNTAADSLQAKFVPSPP